MSQENTSSSARLTLSNAEEVYKTLKILNFAPTPPKIILTKSFYSMGGLLNVSFDFQYQHEKQVRVNQEHLFQGFINLKKLLIGRASLFY